MDEMNEAAAQCCGGQRKKRPVCLYSDIANGIPSRAGRGHVREP